MAKTLLPNMLGVGSRLPFPTPSVPRPVYLRQLPMCRKIQVGRSGPRTDISPGRSHWQESFARARISDAIAGLCEPYHTLHTVGWCILIDELPKGFAETTGANRQQECRRRAVHHNNGN